MINVCHIVNLITGRADGVYAHLKMIFRNCDNTKFQHFLIFQGGGNIEQELRAFGVKVYVSPSLKKKISLKAFFDIYKIVKANRIQIIHTHLIKPYAIAGIVNVFLRKKLIFNYHGLFLDGNVYNNFVEKIIYRFIHFTINLFSNVDAVLVPSKKSKELLMKETKLFPEPIVYYNGSILSRASSLKNTELYNSVEKLKTEKLIIALIGRLEIQKRVDRAIEIMKNILLKRRDISLTIFGEGKLEHELRSLVNNYKLNESVQFFGYINNLFNYYKLFDIVLFTSEWEGMPLTMWEAMVNEVAVIAPDVGGFKEILEENNCGLIYKQTDLKDAEEKILKILNDEPYRKQLGRNGKRTVETKYNEKNFIRQIEQVYLNLSGR